MDEIPQALDIYDKIDGLLSDLEICLKKIIEERSEKYSPLVVCVINRAWHDCEYVLSAFDNDSEICVSCMVLNVNTSYRAAIDLTRTSTRLNFHEKNILNSIKYNTKYLLDLLEPLNSDKNCKYFINPLRSKKLN
jgi:hypothetical protein